MRRCAIPLLGFLALAGNAGAAVRLPAILSDHMVLQRAPGVGIWGAADAGEEVTVRLGGQVASAKADAGGKWKVLLDLGGFGEGPFDLHVDGRNALVVSDVLVGEVWVAAGQSNMEFVLRNSKDAGAAIQAASDSRLRMFKVKRRESDVPVEEAEGGWEVASPQTAGGFSAVGYYFARALEAGLGRPVGVINASVGGTPCEAWTSAEALDGVAPLRESRERSEARLREFPAKRSGFVTAFGAWLEKNGRGDKPPGDVAGYAGPGQPAAAKGWVPIRVPGVVQGSGLPPEGAVWLRREITLSAGSRDPLNVVLTADGFFDVYWNGQPIGRSAWEEFGGLGEVKRMAVPAAAVVPGKNVLAIRFYEPAEPAKVSFAQLGLMPLGGEWQAAKEYELPTVSGDPAPPLIQAPPEPKNMPCRLFNGMIHPLLSYGIKGVVWYQGESNTGNAAQYRVAFPLLVSDWRRRWGQGDFPFYFCQLPANNPKQPLPTESAWAELRESQAVAARELPNAGQAVLIDLGEAGTVHPREKKPVGERLAAFALAGAYGKARVASGPVYRSSRREKDRIVVSFQPGEGGLAARSLPAAYDIDTAMGATASLARNSPRSEIEGFAICGEDRQWVWADAKIEGDTVAVWSGKVPNPVAVRYAWADNPTCNLEDMSGHPASPFRTDGFALTTEKNAGK